MSAESECLVCGNSETKQWTLGNADGTSTMPLCDEHSERLEVLLELARNRPERTDNRKARTYEMRPLNWTPPEEPQLRGLRVLTVPEAKALAARAAAGESKSALADFYGIRRSAVDEYIRAVREAG
jgi:hypothetical protein